MRKTFEEEVDQVSDLFNTDYSDLKKAEIDDYIKRDLIGLQGRDRAFQHAINQTVGRVHQASATSRRRRSTTTSSGTSSACRAATALSSTPSTRPWAVSTRPWRRSCTT